MSHTLTIALATAIFGVLVFIDVLRANRSLPLFRPSLRHRHEQGATHRNAKLNRSVPPVGSVHHQHGSVSK